MPQAIKDQEYWKATHNIRVMKPEPLKGDLKGLWSRRINDEHRMVYSISDGMIYIYILSLRFHYTK